MICVIVFALLVIRIRALFDVFVVCNVSFKFEFLYYLFIDPCSKRLYNL